MDCVSMLRERDGARRITPGRVACMVTIREALSTRDKRPNSPFFWPKVFCPGLGVAKAGIMGEASVLLSAMDWLHDKAWDPLAGSNQNCFLETEELCLLKTTHFHQQSGSFH